MPQLFTFISGILCSSVKIGNRLRFVRPRDRCSIPGSRRFLCSKPQPPHLTQWRPNILFNGHQWPYRWGEHLQKDTHVFVGYVAGHKSINHSIRYTYNLNFFCNFYSIYTTDKFGWGFHNKLLETWSWHALRTSPWLTFYLCTEKLWLSRFPVEIFVNCWSDLKKKVAIKEVIKNFILCILYLFWF